MRGLMAYWYHFAIMFEAVFILTTIDSGTRIGRFLLQEFGGRLWKPLARTDWLPGSLDLDRRDRAGAGRYFIWTGNISTIWPMFGVANQLLAVVALRGRHDAHRSTSGAQQVRVDHLPAAVLPHRSRR